ncbi:MAG TPA: tripartite tricarboxylate transporter substrate binding protein [Burkholderiales bacterium]|nr:tripartite tricarboxylate transporter substrate binding protein [Burkholderiales bacterium]
MRELLRAATAAVCAYLLMVCGDGVAADNARFPTHPIRLIVPFAPGGANDIVARLVAQKMTESLGQTVIVDNRGGAGGTIGTDMVAKARADGYTLLVASMGVAVNAVLYPNLPYDTLKDLAPITMLAEQPNIVVVHPSLPVKSVKELIALARAHPGQVSYASGGIGSNTHLVTVLFLQMAKVDMLHVPYKGLGPAMTDLLGGQVQLIIANVATALPYVKAGRLRLLAVTSKKRFPLFPDTPTVTESGVPGYESTGWYGLCAPAGLSADVLGTLHREVTKILTSTAMTEQLRSQGMEPIPTTPDAFGKQLRVEIGKWGGVVKASGAMK